MPEAPEVYIAAELIRPLILNHICLSVIPSETGRYKNDPPDGLQDFHAVTARTATRVRKVETKGKFMWWEFDHDWYMFLTFGMSGQLSPDKGKHPCMEFDLLERDGNKTRSHQLYFNDPRHFGTIKFVSDASVLENKLASLGWDAMQCSVEDGMKIVYPALQQSKKPIGQMLMDQSVFCGVGNYIKCESLYAAKMSPWKICSTISSDEAKLLCQSIVDVMKASYEYQGATILTYKNAYGEEGRYSSQFKVYGKEKDPYDNPVIKEPTPDKRTTHWCPEIQK